jgi:hypothetical protein
LLPRCDSKCEKKTDGMRFSKSKNMRHLETRRG